MIEGKPLSSVFHTIFQFKSEDIEFSPSIPAFMNDVQKKLLSNEEMIFPLGRRQMQRELSVTRGMDPNNVQMSCLDAPKIPTSDVLFYTDETDRHGPQYQNGTFCRHRLYNLVTPFMYLEAVQEWDRECDTRW